MGEAKDIIKHAIEEEEKTRDKIWWMCQMATNATAIARLSL